MQQEMQKERQIHMSLDFTKPIRRKNTKDSERTDAIVITTAGPGGRPIIITWYVNRHQEWIVDSFSESTAETMFENIPIQHTVTFWINHYKFPLTPIIHLSEKCAKDNELPSYYVLARTKHTITFTEGEGL